MAELIPAALRVELKIGKLTQQGILSFVIKEPDKQAYFHFSDEQFEFISSFDGVKSISQLVEAFNRYSPLYELDIEDAIELYDSCRKFGLLVRSKAENNIVLLEKIKEERAKKLLQGQGSLLFLRFQLVDPNDFFNLIIDKIRFIWHPKVIKLQLIFFVIALIAVLFQGERFINDFNRVYLQAQQGSLGIFSIWLIALGAIAIHECAHGLTCKYYGGDVHEMGFLLLAFQPCLYCNVNDAWLFDNKWQKIYVAIAGIWVELLLAALSVFVWLFIDVANVIGFIAFVLLTIGTATTVMVNLNPLLKFDGYYILTDMLEIKNLRQNSIAWMSYTLKTSVFRLKEEAPFTPTKRERKIYLVYGILVSLYMTFILSFLAFLGFEFISAKFGFIANVAFIYLVFFLVKKITGSWSDTLAYWIKSTFFQTPRKKKRMLIFASLILCLLIFWEPHMRISSSGIVAAPTHVIYAPQNGFIKKIHYDQARELTHIDNMPFAELGSTELDMKKLQLDSEQQMLKMQQQEASSLNEINLVNQLLIEQALFEQKSITLNNQIQSLKIFSPPGDWLVEAAPVKTQLGRYFLAGDVMLSLIDRSQRYLDVIVDQRDVSLIKIGDQGRIKLTGYGTQIYSGTVTGISPLAKLEGIEQSVLIRMSIEYQNEHNIPVIGLPADVIILGNKHALWRHILHIIRKTLRADLWL
jgi:putative peptide zinc metalloprotease protein